MSAVPYWQIPARPVLVGMCAELRYGTGVILRARLARNRVWRVDWCGSYSTLNDINKRRGFPPDGGPDADLCALPVRSWPDARVMR